MAHQWMPAPLERILDPFLEHCSKEERTTIRRALKLIADNPYDPPYLVRPYKGHDVPNAFIVVVDDFWIRYQVMRDYPLLLLWNIIRRLG